MKTLENFFQILNYKEKKNFIYLILMLTIVALSEAISIGSLIPLIKIILDNQYIDTFKQIINIQFINNIPNDKFSIFIITTVFLFFSIKYVFYIIFYFALHKFSFSLRYRLQKITFETYLNKNLKFFKDNNTSFLLRNLTTEIDQFTVAISSYLIIISEVLVIFGLTLMVIFFQSSKAIIVLICLTFFTIICFKIIKNRSSKLGIERKLNIGNQLKIINDAFGLIIDVILFKKQNFFIRKFKSFAKKTNSSMFRHNFYKSLPRVIFEWVFLAIIIFMLLYLIDNENFSESVANVTFLTAIIFKLIPSFNKIFVSYQDIRFSLPVLQEINKKFFFDKDYQKNNVNEDENTDFIFNKLEFKNVDFFYDKKDIILENLEFTLKKNKFIGIFGDSGGGKTTFINLLLGLLNSDKGDILINGEKNNNILHKFQKSISYVPQDIYLIDSSIKENVALKEQDELSFKNLEDIKLALKDAEFKFGEGEISNDILSRKVGQKGINLSGGQLQRIGIARAFYRNSQILILDEATRSLDQSTEEEIVKTLLKKKNSITIIMISHNMNNFKFCDEVYQIKDRKIIKFQNHRPL